MKEILLNYFQNSFLNERSLDVFRNESFVMEDNLVEDVSRGANLVVEGMERNRNRETTSVEDPRQQQTPFGAKLPRDTSSRRESKERQEETRRCTTVRNSDDHAIPLR